MIRSHLKSATHFITTINNLFLEQLVAEPTRYRVGQIIIYNHYAIEKLNPVNDKHKSTSKDWLNSKARYETGMVKTIETHCTQNINCILENEWIMASNLSTKISDVARSQYESRIIMNCKNNPKTFFSYVKTIIIRQEMYPHWRTIMDNLLLVISLRLNY